MLCIVTARQQSFGKATFSVVPGRSGGGVPCGDPPSIHMETSPYMPPPLPTWLTLTTLRSGIPAESMLCETTRLFQLYLPPANEVCEGYVFTGVCLSTTVSSEGGSLSGGISVQEGGLCPGEGLCQGDPPPYGNVRAVRILLECILVPVYITERPSEIYDRFPTLKS